MPLEIIRLGPVDGYVMTNAFVAIAESVSRKGRGDTLVLCHPSAPFANAGVHQEVEREIDTRFCRENSIPVVRRVIGGGAIADGPWEQDYFLISSLDSDTTRGTIAEYYGRMLDPIQAAVRHFGVNAERQGLNDLAVGGKKISANGAVDIDGARVLTGDILMDLNIKMMSGILRVPDEKFRGKIADSMSSYLTSLKEQTGKAVERREVEDTIAAEFTSRYGGAAIESTLTDSELARIMELVQERSSASWIFEREETHSMINSYLSRVVKIREGMFLCRQDRKAQKLVRVTMLVDNGNISDITISGDFFTVPVSWPVARLESALIGRPLDRAQVEEAVRKRLLEDGVTIMGATPEDIAATVMGAADNPIIVPAG